MKPKAIRNPANVRGTDGLLRFEMADAGREFILDPLAEVVWDLSDGSRSLEALAQAAGRALDRVVHREEVFAALDFLADVGLVEERVAPPVAEGNVSRRSLLVRMGPVVGAAAWMMSGVSAKAGGLLQYNESASKESDNKARDREYNNKESGNKAARSESENKESGNKAARGESDNKERDNKEHDNKADDKQDWDRQQDAEKSRKRDFQKTMEESNKAATRAEQLERKMKVSWPRVYELVGHRLSEFPELREIWEREGAPWGQTELNADNYALSFLQAEGMFYREVRKHSVEARNRFTKAGFDLSVLSTMWILEQLPPVLAGDTEGKTYLKLDQIAYPGIGDNWRYAFDADNLQFRFQDTEAAYQFLSNRRATGRQTQK